MEKSEREREKNQREREGERKNIFSQKNTKTILKPAIFWGSNFAGEITTPKNRRPQSKSALASLPERKGASYVNTSILLNNVNAKMDNKPIFLG